MKIEIDMGSLESEMVTDECEVGMSIDEGGESHHGIIDKGYDFTKNVQPMLYRNENSEEEFG